MLRYPEAAVEVRNHRYNFIQITYLYGRGRTIGINYGKSESIFLHLLTSHFMRYVNILVPLLVSINPIPM